MSERQNNPEEITPEIIEVSSTNDILECDEQSAKIQKQADKATNAIIDIFQRIGQKSDVAIQGKKSSAMLIKQIESGKLKPDERQDAMEKNMEYIKYMTIDAVTQRFTIISITAIAATASIVAYGLKLKYK